MNNTISRLCKAIRDSELIEMEYKGITYLVESYLLFEGKNGQTYLHGWKVSSSDSIKKDGPHWANFIVDEITSVRKFGNFKAPLEGFKPHSKSFYKVLYYWGQK